MKDTGMSRQVDELGRVVLPKELRRSLNITDGKDYLQIFVEGDSIVLRKRQTSCIFCGKGDDLVNVKGKYVCPCCIQDIKEG